MVELVDPYAVLLEHPDITLVREDLPRGQRGRWYPQYRVIMVDRGLTAAEERVTVTHELIHALRADEHLPDAWFAGRQEQFCHSTVARLLIPLERLAAALQWGRDEQEYADELGVDVETINARIDGLTDTERAFLQEQVGDALEDTA